MLGTREEYKRPMADRWVDETAIVLGACAANYGIAGGGCIG